MYSKKVLVFAGTTEGRLLSLFLEKNKISADVCVVSEYGKELMGQQQYINVLLGRLDENDILKLINTNFYDFVIDATHPFATVITENIKNACKITQSKYIRILRQQVKVDGAIVVDSFSSAIAKLNESDENILLTIGSKELFRFFDVVNFKNRIYARALPTVDAISKCKALGLKSSNIILMQGPFTEELNCATLKQYNCKFMVTKASGDIGGLDEKQKAVKKCGADLIIIDLPNIENGLSRLEVELRLKEYYAN